jgi:hypothetical protein
MWKLKAHGLNLIGKRENVVLVQSKVTLAIYKTQQERENESLHSTEYFKLIFCVQTKQL